MTTETSVPVRFHLSLNVSSLPRAVSYFERVFGQAPAKVRSDYAKFELESPPVVLSLEQNAPERNGSLNHLGFRYADSQTLVAVQRRLEEAGLNTQREEGVECCYARQTKFWLHDFDKRLWEFYTLEEDLDHRGAGQSLEQMVGAEAATAQLQVRLPVIWQHRMYEPFALPDEPCDEVLLRGTFNVPISAEHGRRCLTQAFSAMRPGAKLTVHTLTSEIPVASELKLPGPAAYVKHVPVRTDLMRDIEFAGFRDSHLTIFRSGACFEHQGVPLRETQIVAYRPAEECGAQRVAIFKGPFAQVTDDFGHVWKRGEPVAIPLARWEALQASTAREMFVELPAAASVSHCGTSFSTVRDQGAW